MRRAVTLFALLLLAAPAWGQSVTLPKTVYGAKGEWVVVVPETRDGGEPRWRVGPGLNRVPLDKLFPGQKAAGVVVSSPTDGTYEVWAWTAKGDQASDIAVCKVVIGDPGPVPPPGPDPPVPPTPGGLRVLIVYETADLSALPASQLSVLNGQEVRDYLNAKCLKVGNTAEWRIWDKDVDAAAESAEWRAIFARPRREVPWLVVSTPQGGYEGALPKTVADMMALLKKYGG